MNLEQIIGTNIRVKREEKSIKLESLAKHLGISKARMSQIEHGGCRELTIARIKKIAEYLDANFLEIVNLETGKENSNNLNSSTISSSNITPELIKSLADELAKRMQS